MAKAPPATTDVDTPGTANPPVENVSLGPACGVLFLMGGVLIAVIVTVAAYLLMGKQGERASAAIQQQLIPLVERSQLPANDKSDIVDRLNVLAFEIEGGEVTDRQLARLHTRLSQNAILQWGAIYQTVEFAETNDEFTDSERDELKKISNRLLYACSQFKITIDDLGFLLQQLTLREGKSGLLILREEITHGDVVSFMRRSEEMMDQRGVPKVQPAEQTVAQVFESMVDDAMNEDKKLPIAR